MTSPPSPATVRWGFNFRVGGGLCAGTGMFSLSRTSGCSSDLKPDQLSLQLLAALCGLDVALGSGGGFWPQFTISGITAGAAVYIGLLFLVCLVSAFLFSPRLIAPKSLLGFYSLGRTDWVPSHANTNVCSSTGWAMPVPANRDGKIWLENPVKEVFSNSLFQNRCSWWSPMALFCFGHLLFEKSL